MPRSAEAKTDEAPQRVDQGVLDELVGYALRRAQLVVYEDFARALGASLTPQRFAALVLVGNNPGLSQTALGELLQIARSGSMVLVDWLEQEGLVERRPRPEDRRSYGLHLSTRGACSLEAWQRDALAHDRRMTERLDEAERTELHRLLCKLAQR
jgi:DNA-binding MarR family transcriptional regulator